MTKTGHYIKLKKNSIGKHAIKPKQLTGNVQHSLGTLTKPDGTTTEPGQDTLEYLLRAHFPSITEIKPTEYTELKIQTCEIMKREIQWILIDKIGQVFNKFKSKKSPGPDGLQPLILKTPPY